MNEKIEEVLEKKIRPQLFLHGGEIRMLNFCDGTFQFELLGECANCPSASITAEELVRASLIEAIPEIKEVVLVQQVNKELISQARAILQKYSL